MKKGNLEIEQLGIWLLALLFLAVLILIAFRYKEKLIDTLASIMNLFRFGGG